MNKLLVSQIVPEEYKATRWRATPPAATKPKDLENPLFWVNVSNAGPRRVKIGDIIDVVPEGNEWLATVFVLASDKALGAVVKVLNLVSLRVDNAPIKAEAETATSARDAAKDTTDEYYVKHRGGAGWSVLRTADNEVVKDRLQTREEAEEHMEALKLAA